MSNKQTILIVDDEYSGRETLESILEGEGYNLAMAENGPQAIAQAKSILPDVILLDIMMPGMTGFEVCQRIRNDPQIAEIPIIMLTTTDDPREIERCYQLGCSVYITKPVMYEEFVEAVKRLGLFLNIVKVPPEKE